MPSAQFATGSSKIGKRAAGRSALGRTPVVIRSPDPLGAGFEQRIRTQLARRIGHAAGRIERITVRFDDVNGPRGGVDTVCRIKVVVAGRPSILVEKQANAHGSAFARAAASLVPRSGGRRASTGCPPGAAPDLALRVVSARRGRTRAS